jgi:hypothetical protein
MTTNNNKTEPPFKPKAFVPDLDEQNVYQSRPQLVKNQIIKEEPSQLEDTSMKQIATIDN